jgi:hypothetical protein
MEYGWNKLGKREASRPDLHVSMSEADFAKPVLQAPKNFPPVKSEKNFFLRSLALQPVVEPVDPADRLCGNLS